MKRFNYASLTIVGLIFIVAVIRITHVLPNNFAPVTALCLIGSAYFSRRWMAFLFPAAVMILSDFTLGFSRPVEIFAIYFSYMLIILMGFNLKDSTRPIKVLGISIASSLLFFVLTNFACWIGNPVYTQDFNGLAINYIGAVPFYRSSFISDLFFTSVFFTAFELIKFKFPAFARVK